jgi:hypothetical protein
MCTWAPTRRVKASFARAFTNVIAFDDGAILVGSRDHIVLDPLLWQRRLAAGPGAHLGHGQLAGLVRSLRGARPLDRSVLDSATPNRDLHPRDEFASP